MYERGHALLFLCAHHVSVDRIDAHPEPGLPEETPAELLSVAPVCMIVRKLAARCSGLRVP